MKPIVKSRLENIQDLQQRRLLREILLDCFENLEEYNLAMYTHLEKRIYDEIDDPLDKFYIYTTLEEAGNVDPISDFLFPMNPEDLDASMDMALLRQQIADGEESVLFRIFMKLDAMEFQKMLLDCGQCEGYIQTDQKRYAIKMRLRQSARYTQAIERLYKVFQLNSVNWNTVNCPYASKFVDILPAEPWPCNEEEEIKEIGVHLGQYEPYKMVNMVPLWNIKAITQEDKSFPMPAIDRITYEHRIDLQQSGIQNGYLVDLDNEDFTYAKREENEMILISGYAKQQTWRLIQIADGKNAGKQSYSFPLTANKKDLGFVGRYASVKSMVVRTKGEIARILNAYESAKKLRFIDVEILDCYEESRQQTKDLNSFVDDNIRVDKTKKVMRITFQPVGVNDYLLMDEMSFLVSEIQALFPEYRCVGELTA